MRRKIFLIFIIIFVLFTIIVSILALKYKTVSHSIVQDFMPESKVYYAEDFCIETIKSNTDYDNDGIDDYTDILEGAKIDAENKPTYRSAYYSGGYPPDDEGVCTDVIWRALKNAGYLLKDMIDEDIKNNVSLLKNIKSNVITYGFNAKATITISSIKEENIMLCIQRSIKGINGMIEEQEINLKMEKNAIHKLYNILILFTILAIYGEFLKKI